MIKHSMKMQWMWDPTTKNKVSLSDLHLMLKNFSIPMSAPKPASVTTYPFSPTSLRAT